MSVPGCPTAFAHKVVIIDMQAYTCYRKPVKAWYILRLTFQQFSGTLDTVEIWQDMVCWLGLRLGDEVNRQHVLIRFRLGTEFVIDRDRVRKRGPMWGSFCVPNMLNRLKSASEHNFGKCRPIFKILSLSHSWRNYYVVFYLTLIALLHYLAKFNNFYSYHQN